MGKISFELTSSENLIDENYSIRIDRICQEYCSNRKIEENNKKARDFALHYVMYGSGILKTETNTYNINAGCAFLLYEGESYEYYPTRTDPWAYIWLNMKGENLDVLFGQMGFTKQKPFVRITKSGEIMELFKKLYTSNVDEVDSEISCYGYLAIILEKLLKNHETSDTTKNKNILHFKRVREILTYLICNYRMEFTLADIAYEFHVSERTLMRMIKDEIGMSPMEFLTAYRIAQACEILTEQREIPINEVAEEVGYKDQRYFSRIFKKLKGVTPTEYAADSGSDDPYGWIDKKYIFI